MFTSILLLLDAATSALDNFQGYIMFCGKHVRRFLVFIFHGIKFCFMRAYYETCENYFPQKLPYVAIVYIAT